MKPKSVVQGFGFGDEGFGCAAIQRRSRCLQTPNPRPETRGVLGGGAIDEALRAVAQDLAERSSQVLRVRSRVLLHQHAIAIVGVAAAAHRQHAVERVIAGVRRAIGRAQRAAPLPTAS